MMGSRTSLVLTVLAVALLALPAVVTAQGSGGDVTVPSWHRELPGGRQTAEIVVGDTPLTVDLALTPDQQSLGLGYRNGLEPGRGMLFVGNDARPRTFWMKGMRFCLDIVWIQDDRIVGAAEQVCPDPPGTSDIERDRFSSPEPVTHVLEVPAGWLSSHGYGPGTTVDLSAVP